MLNQVLFTWIRQHSVEVLSKSVTFLDFWISQGSVAIYCRWGGYRCDMYIENFLTNHLVKEFWELVRICQSYHQTSRGLVFLGTRCRYDADVNIHLQQLQSNVTRHHISKLANTRYHYDLLKYSFTIRVVNLEHPTWISYFSSLSRWY